MKFILKIAFLASVSCLVSCRKYPDGPTFSLESKKSRIANVWTVDKFFINGTDQTDFYRSLIKKETMVLLKEGRFKYSEVSNWAWAMPDYEGKWELIHNKEDIEMTPDDPNLDTKTYKILRLKSKEMWLQREIKADSLIQFNFVPQLEN